MNKPKLERRPLGRSGTNSNDIAALQNNAALDAFAAKAPNAPNVTVHDSSSQSHSIQDLAPTMGEPKTPKSSSKIDESEYRYPEAAKYYDELVHNGVKSSSSIRMDTFLLAELNYLVDHLPGAKNKNALIERYILDGVRRDMDRLDAHGSTIFKS